MITQSNLDAQNFLCTRCGARHHGRMHGQEVAIGERRVSERRDVTWPVRVLRANGERCAGVCTDIGGGGVGFHTAAVLRAGEIIAVEFPEAVADAVVRHPTVKVQIIYRIRDQYGASFVSHPE